MSYADGNNVRVEETLKIKISEVRNLPPRTQGSPKFRSPFVTVNLDQETVFATSVIKNSQNPYFGEETQFEIPRKFRFLNVYVYDKNDPNPNGQINGALGKVAIAKQDLCKFNGKDQWFPIVPVDSDSEVKGKVHVEVFRVNSALAVRLKECADLTIVKNTCDPFALVSVEHHPNSKDATPLMFKTKVWRKTTVPRFDETFYFPESMLDYDKAEIRICVWHESVGVWGHVFLGEIRIPLNGLDAPHHKAWYFLQPRDQSRSTNVLEKGGAIRLSIRYSSDEIISSECYEPLRQLLLESASFDPITSSAVYILGELCDDKLDVAKPIVRIFLHHDKLPDLIRSLAQLEMNVISDVNTLFRGNTLLSKCVDELMKLVGRFYLQAVLKEIIDKIHAENKCCEIDVSKMTDPNDLTANLENLVGYIKQILDAITQSALSCPVLISEILAELKRCAVAKYPNRPEIQYSVIAGFILLRFFAPAILGPKLFALRKEGGCPSNVSRTLTLISKTVQSVGNCLSNENNKILFKEPYMAPVFERFCTDPYLSQMKRFLETVSSANLIHCTFPVKLKEGYLTKRAQSRKRFGLKNLRRRYFCLSTHELTYAKERGSAPLCRIPVAEILSAECVQEDSFNMKNMLQIIQPYRQLYMQASHCVEAREWMDALSFVVQRNQRKRDVFHPGAFVSGVWQCCRKPDHAEPGCCAVTAAQQVPVDIDVDRETEKVHMLFLANIERLVKMQSNCDSEIEIQLTGESVPRPFDDPNSRRMTIENIYRRIVGLERAHKRHTEQMCQEHYYGSEFAPIGEDNYTYLLLANTGATATAPGLVKPRLN
ncbi:ras GTPase-activating protein 3-like isoform X2 [Paramacrobiotus metropolitanus]|uniref:ras GTPase-activating protein 3-like isoform X2 n=1 Tax=Paramacrobiotus metropolitanus TaxID=2943436 RepID=UPI002445C3D6|nr:ras GTPase-activating protein 3-like isoform X2 [Paramacrobiotus metropolitanus]